MIQDLGFEKFAIQFKDIAFLFYTNLINQKLFHLQGFYLIITSCFFDNMLS